MNRATRLMKLGQKGWACYNDFMSKDVADDSATAVWGPYPNYDDIARFEYGRRLWHLPAMRSRLLNHWTDMRHPYRERFLKQRELIEEVLNSEAAAAQVDERLRKQGTSLRCIAREIPPVFGDFF
jgi:hypothetical protein